MTFRLVQGLQGLALALKVAWCRAGSGALRSAEAGEKSGIDSLIVRCGTAIQRTDLRDGDDSMAVVIVGATGVLGRALVPLIEEHGQRVRALVRSPDRAHELLGADVEESLDRLVGDIVGDVAHGDR